MERGQMINELTAEAVEYFTEALGNGETDALESYLYNGFIGFANMSDEELRLNYRAAFGEEV